MNGIHGGFLKGILAGRLLNFAMPGPRMCLLGSNLNTILKTTKSILIFYFVILALFLCDYYTKIHL